MKKFLLWLLVVAIGVTAWKLVPDAAWTYIFFLRVPLIASAFIFVLPFLAQKQLSAMFKNIFILRGKWQLTTVIVGAIMTGMAIVLVGYAIWTNASDRFGLPPVINIPEVFQYGAAIVLGFPTCYMVYQLAEKNPIRIEPKYKFWHLLLGIVISLGLLLLVAWARDWLFNREEFKHAFARAILFISRGKVQGYVKASGELNRGHLSAIAFLAVSSIVYLIIGWLFRPKPKAKRRESPALLYILILTGIFCLMLGGATFFLDLFRIPVLFMFGVLFIFSYLLFKVDHFFNLTSIEGKSLPIPTFKEFINARLKHQDTSENSERTLVIICASGGGIQAAAWTAQVLTGLQEVLGVCFSKAIGLISGVSGGSVGAMYYLDRFESPLGYPDKKDLGGIVESAMDDSLDAVGWGLAYLDLWRFVTLPFLVKPQYDRGTSIETDWEGQMTGSSLTPHPANDKKAVKTLANWRAKIAKGEMPVPVFNSTLVENGQRFLISPMTFQDLANSNSSPNYIDFNTLYPNCDITAVTAARLSATFPYVSPICTPESKPEIADKIESKKYHFADGGYFDNSGFATAAEWLDMYLEKQKDLNKKIERVLILQINSFPKSASVIKGDKPKGFIMATLGPLLALYKVRDPILADRNENEAQLLVEKWESQPQGSKVKIKYYPIFFPSIEDLEELKEKSKVETVQKIDPSEFFDPKTKQYQPPLSWKLSEGQKAAIKRGWEAIANSKDRDGVIPILKDLWHNKWKMPQ